MIHTTFHDVQVESDDYAYGNLIGLRVLTSADKEAIRPKHKANPTLVDFML